MALAGVAQWIEHWPENQRVAGLIPRSGHMPGLQARSPVEEYERQPHIDVSLSLSFFLPSPLSKINKIFKKKTKINQ